VGGFKKRIKSNTTKGRTWVKGTGWRYGTEAKKTWHKESRSMKSRGRSRRRGGTEVGGVDFIMKARRMQERTSDQIQTPLKFEKKRTGR